MRISQHYSVRKIFTFFRGEKWVSERWGLRSYARTWLSWAPIWGPPALSPVFGHLSRLGLCSWQHKPHPDLQYIETGFGVEFCKYIFFWKSLEIPHTGGYPFVKMLIHQGTQLDWVVFFSSTQVHWLMCLVTLPYYWPIESNLPAAGLRDPSRTVAPKLSGTPASLRGLFRVHDFWAPPQIQWSESLGEHMHGWVPQVALPRSWGDTHQHGWWKLPSTSAWWS